MSGALIPPGMANDEVAQAYARWLTQAPSARQPASLKELASKLETSEAHLIALHGQAWWPSYVEQIAGPWTPGFSRFIDDQVLEALAKKAMGGDPASVRMYLTMRGYMQPSPKSRRRDSDDELEELLNDRTAEGTARLEKLLELEAGDE